MHSFYIFSKLFNTVRKQVHYNFVKAVKLNNSCIICHNTTESIQYICDRCYFDIPKLQNEPAIYCQFCSQTLFNQPSHEITAQASRFICHQCSKKKSYLDLTRIYYPYVFPFNYWVKQYKFHRQYYIAELFAELFLNQLTKDACFSDIDLIAPIPSHPERMMQHGFDHCTMLTKLISKKANIPYGKLLVRQKHSPPMSSLATAQRKKHIKNNFKCISKIAPALINKKIALVDDVYTSGSTSQEAAKTLKANGYKYIELWAMTKTVKT